MRVCVRGPECKRRRVVKSEWLLAWYPSRRGQGWGELKLRGKAGGGSRKKEREGRRHLRMGMHEGGMNGTMA